MSNLYRQRHSKQTIGPTVGMHGPYADNKARCYNRCAHREIPAQAEGFPVAARSIVGEWLSLVEHLVRDQGVGGSNPLSPTIKSR